MLAIAFYTWDTPGYVLKVICSHVPRVCRSTVSSSVLQNFQLHLRRKNPKKYHPGEICYLDHTGEPYSEYLTWLNKRLLTREANGQMFGFSRARRRVNTTTYVKTTFAIVNFLPGLSPLFSLFPTKLWPRLDSLISPRTIHVIDPYHFFSCSA